LNVSLGTEDIAPMRDAVRYAYRRNVLVVAATPGDPTPYPAPARYPHVLSVAASDTASRPLNPAPHGVPHLVLAPGDGILTTTLGGGYGLFCPCVSIAAPAVSGIAALIFSIRPDLSVDAVISAIELGARPLAAQHSPDSVRGWGIVDAERSVQIALALPPGGGNVQMPHAQVASVLSPQSKSWTEPQFPPLESTPP
jgi:subtilisin family serine protease